jgi:acyl-[acyl-carrier-protein]-phospholipid O-acyltransferase/long-chain-fatty-acid--[acyl-carrier-protein] ligase
MNHRHSLAYLNITQFLAALNDNIFKLLIVYLLISIMGQEYSSEILSLSGAVFVIPFILFSLPSGVLADKLSKRQILVTTKYIEIVVMSVGLFTLGFQSPLGLYMVLFFMATQSAIFGPSKYGIIPEITHPNAISRANGLLTLFTFLAIIVGTFLASFLTQITHRNYLLVGLVCEIIAILGLIFCLRIEETPPANPSQELRFFLFKDVYHALKVAKSRENLLTLILSSTLFWFMGAFVQMNVIPFSIQKLHMSDIYGGYLFLTTAFGIGIGSILCGYFSGKTVEIGFVAISGLCIGLTLIILGSFVQSFTSSIVFMIILGIFGGFYSVPTDSFIQVTSPIEDRGKIIASNNVINFTGIFMASGALAFFKSIDLEVNHGFTWVGLIMIIFMILIFLFTQERVYRLFYNLKTRFKYHVSYSQDLEKELRLYHYFVLVDPQPIKVFALMSSSSRMIFYQEGSIFEASFLKRLHQMKIFHPKDISVEKLISYSKKGRSICLLGLDEKKLSLFTDQALKLTIEDKGKTGFRHNLVIKKTV